ncbi:sensor histidine kinase [Microcoleus sp. FACHB-SPT15]|uniref:sensor histidine kinase n=1 Tax=Microcoleus sp. FACHB-SPT15 TaxID=2692830 RepID=UPI0018EFC180|nr:HAMP domain-containing sensor histidine kinase [Microcoleus sp. FACHB-SPT15]
MNPQSLPNQLQLPSKNAIGWVSQRLSIRQKIAFGYALALGIAVLGTTVGLAIANHYEQQAEAQKERAMKEIHSLDRLQTSSLQTLAHQQQFIFLIGKSKPWQSEYAHYLEHSAEFKQLWSTYKSSNSNLKQPKYPNLNDNYASIKSFMQAYEGLPEAYIEQSDKNLKQIASLNLDSEEIKVAQQVLLDFNDSPIAFKFDTFSDDLTELVNLAHEDYEQAKAYYDTAQEIRFQIVTASILLSVAIAVLLVMYISRAIAMPIQATTNIAQKVTKEKNFDLQAPITTKDEVGALTLSFNELIQQVKQLLEEQKAASQDQMIQSEKMSSLGRMMAGVAHEVNNPLNFIYGNLIYASDYVEKLLVLLEAYTAEIPHPSEAIQEMQEEIDLEFLKEDLPKVLQSMKLGAERATQIVLSLKDFSRLDKSNPHPVDLHACMDSTLLILNNRLKKEIKVIRNYDNIPAIEGYAGLLYQVFMNLLSNAIDALEKLSESKLIAITIECQDQNSVIIKITDNGLGISPENQAKIFDAFFTTKPRGVGTGLGLAISREIIVEKHGGKITCNSEEGVGTEFAIALPIKHQYTSKPHNQFDSLATTAEKSHRVNLI